MQWKNMNPRLKMESYVNEVLLPLQAKDFGGVAFLKATEKLCGGVLCT